MPFATYPALFFTVALLVTSAYFLLGGLPLLTLAHDTPLDSRFVRSFFNVYFVAALITGAGTAISYAFLGKAGFALGAAVIAVAALLMRKLVLPTMDKLHARILGNDNLAIRHFRAIHVALLLSDLVQLAVIVWALTTLKL